MPISYTSRSTHRLRLNKVQKAAVAALEDIKARDITVLDTRTLTAIYDTLIIATAESARQTKALARNVSDKVKAAGGHVISTEGEESGEWVLVDCADMVVHIMPPTTRALQPGRALDTAHPGQTAQGSQARGPESRPTPAAASKAKPNQPRPRLHRQHRQRQGKASRSGQHDSQTGQQKPAAKTAAKKPATKAPANRKPAAKKPAAKNRQRRNPPAKSPPKACIAAQTSGQTRRKRSPPDVAAMSCA